MTKTHWQDRTYHALVAITSLLAVIFMALGAFGGDGLFSIGFILLVVSALGRLASFAADADDARVGQPKPCETPARKAS
jgi:hypothetical protein